MLLSFSFLFFFSYSSPVDSIAHVFSHFHYVLRFVNQFISINYYLEFQAFCTSFCIGSNFTEEIEVIKCEGFHWVWMGKHFFNFSYLFHYPSPQTLQKCWLLLISDNIGHFTILNNLVDIFCSFIFRFFTKWFSQIYKQIQLIPVLIKASSELHGLLSHCHFTFLSFIRNLFSIFILKKEKYSNTVKNYKYSQMDILFLSCWKESCQHYIP